MSFARVHFAALRHFSVINFGSTVLQVLGALWLLLKLTTFLFPDFYQTVLDFRWAFIFAGVLIGLWRAWPRLSVKYKISGTDALIEIRVCDLMEQNAVLVVSSNTTFDTSIEDRTISRTSTQGQFSTRYCQPLEDLNRQLDNALQGFKYEERNPDTKPYGKTREYAIGTVASVFCGGKTAYFLAIASLNANRNASATREDILDALPRLWEFVRTQGDLDPIAVPIIGSGLARVAATREELVREIIKSFIAAAQEGRFCEHLTIAISPEDFRAKHIDLPVLGDFLQHECTYVYGPQLLSSAPYGTPAEP